MNIDIKNFGHYRVTSHGGRSYQLFNRSTDRVMDINRDDWVYISEVGLDACIQVEKEKTE
ncbi:hypothetical protein [Rhizobium sp. CECT 9324]|uniref:hypothetical protein n=1 Tax=Rhizobium sp. CECT 9324 TaxID=2845820 RepID=UPI001E397DE5|nr:hypothetical protein [Rhizobium sp. CECT 9324]CAH0343741.1 hypothetical protein RHI9324_05478 [Rhizobium sp. CECT 9324]